MKIKQAQRRAAKDRSGRPGAKKMSKMKNRSEIVKMKIVISFGSFYDTLSINAKIYVRRLKGVA